MSDSEKSASAHAEKGTPSLDAIIQRFNDAYDKKEALSSITKDLIKDGTLYTLDERNEIVERLTDAYIESTGKSPDNQTLYYLGNFILSDYFSDRSTNKRNQPYAFDSPEQERYIKRKGRSVSFGYFNMAKGYTTGYKASSFEDTDGVLKTIRQPINVYNV